MDDSRPQEDPGVRGHRLPHRHHRPPRPGAPDASLGPAGPRGERGRVAPIHAPGIPPHWPAPRGPGIDRGSGGVAEGSETPGHRGGKPRPVLDGAGAATGPCRVRRHPGVYRGAGEGTTGRRASAVFRLCRRSAQSHGAALSGSRRRSVVGAGVWTTATATAGSSRPTRKSSRPTLRQPRSAGTGASRWEYRGTWEPSRSN